MAIAGHVVVVDAFLVRPGDEAAEAVVLAPALAAGEEQASGVEGVRLGGRHAVHRVRLLVSAASHGSVGECRVPVSWRRPSL